MPETEPLPVRTEGENVSAPRKGGTDTVRKRASEETVETVLRVLSKAHGVDASAYDHAFFQKAVEKRMFVVGGVSFAAYADLLAADRKEAEALGLLLRVGYSEFFRDSLTFALLEHVVLPGLIAEKKRDGRGEIRVWSAGCAAGQEAWSVAVLLDELIARDAAPLTYRIFATDLPGPDLERARSGSYRAEALGNILLRHLNTYFIRSDDVFTVVPQVRSKVEFSAYDLLDEKSTSPAASIYGDFDLIFCCNLLFYYSAAARQRIVEKVNRALAPGGFFVTGEVERDIVAKTRGLRVWVATGPVFQKERFP